MKNDLLDARIVIQSTENTTLQGVLYVDAQEHLFRSEIELILLINKLTGEIDGYNGWISNRHDTGKRDK